MKFQPISRSWVAIHPQSKGVLQFIGGAFFGTFFPTFFYRGLLSFLYDQGYTIIVLPFSFTFNHYAEAGFLITEQYNIIPDLVKIAIQKSYDFKVYLEEKNYSWLGHSIGTKYITLLEGFTSLPQEAEQRAEAIQAILQETRSKKQIDAVILQIDILYNYLLAKVQEVKQQVNASYQQEVQIDNLFIRDQPSILMAPVNTGTDAAIPSKALAKLFDKWGKGVSPSPEETFKLIQVSKLFNKMGLISFEIDDLAPTTVNYFLNTLRKPVQDLQSRLPGGHYRPMGDLKTKGKNLACAFFNAFFTLRRSPDLKLYEVVEKFFMLLA